MQRNDMKRAKSSNDIPVVVNLPKDVRKTRSDLGLNHDDKIQQQISKLQDFYEKQKFLLNFKKQSYIDSIDELCDKNLQSLKKKYIAIIEKEDTLNDERLKILQQKYNQEKANIKEKFNQEKEEEEAYIQKYKHFLESAQLDKIQKLQVKENPSSREVDTSAYGYVKSFKNFIIKSKESSNTDIISEEEQNSIKSEWKDIGERGLQKHSEKIRFIVLYYREIARNCGKEVKKEIWNELLNKAEKDLSALQVQGEAIKNDLQKWKDIESSKSSEREMLKQSIKIQAFYEGSLERLSKKL